MAEKEAKIVVEQFDWNDNLSQVALEDFRGIQGTLSYGVCTTIGMALGKLALLEKQGCVVAESEVVT